MYIEHPRFEPFIFWLTPSLEILRYQFIRIISKAVTTDSWVIILHRLCYWEGFLDIIWDRTDEIRSQYMQSLFFLYAWLILASEHKKEKHMRTFFHLSRCFCCVLM